MALSQSEVAHKIRSSIKQKLLDMNVFVDNELPDYIMVLVANKRSKSHMEKDLALFLGSKTADFTSWLWNLVGNFKGGSQSKGEASKSDTNTEIEEDTDVLDYDPEEQEGDFLDEEKVPKSPTYVKAIKTEVVDASKSISNIPAPLREPSSLKIPVKQAKAPDKPVLKSAKVYPVQSHVAPVFNNTVPIPAPIQPMINPVHQYTNVNQYDQYDPTRPYLSSGVSNLSSVVCVKQRNYAGPLAWQANKLLQRAVSDATKSILEGRSLLDFYKPTPIKILSKRNELSCPVRSDLVHAPIEEKLGFGTSNASEENEPFFFNNNNQPALDFFTEEESYAVTEPSKNTRTICLPSEPQYSVLDEELENSPPSPIYSPEEQNPTSPHFIVTLDGVDFPSLKRKRSEGEEEEPMEIDPEAYSEDADVVSDKKQKVSERCKYWPVCKNEECTYHHPTITCNKFPDCTFGDKCLYIHPNCKFDELCSRRDCPYTHASKRKFPIPPSRPMNAVKVKPPKTVCKFYPNCGNVKCPFIHPKPCRYGTKCRAPNCLFSHFSVPSRKQMKWTAEVT